MAKLCLYSHYKTRKFPFHIQRRLQLGCGFFVSTNQRNKENKKLGYQITSKFMLYLCSSIKLCAAVNNLFSFFTFCTKRTRCSTWPKNQKDTLHCREARYTISFRIVCMRGANQGSQKIWRGQAMADHHPASSVHTTNITWDNDSFQSSHNPLLCSYACHSHPSLLHLFL